MINGTFLKQIREEKHLTQAALAAKIGAEGNLVSRWEKGRASPSQKYLLKLSEILEIPINFLLKSEAKTDIKELSVTENKGMLTFDLNGAKLEVPATSEFSEQFWKRVDRIIDMMNKKSLVSTAETTTE